MSAPIVRRIGRRLNGDIVVTFDGYGSTLAVRAGEPTLVGFETAGSDGVFRPARAWIEDDEVIVMADDDTRQVRYAWMNNTGEANLVNAEGWAASPFRLAVPDRP